MATTRILVVDDEEDLCEILKFNLEIEGYEVDTAYSAEEALKKDLTVYNLLLLDVMMGEISGFKMARILRQDEKTANTPIIFLTAKDTENDMLTGFNLGADDYISKPFSIRQVIARVKAVLRRTSEKSKEKEIEKDQSEGILTDTQFKNMTLNDLFEIHMDTRKLAESTQANYRRMWNSLVRNELGQMKVVQVRPSHVRLFYSRLSKQKYSHSTIKFLHNMILPSFEVAVDDDIIRKNPAKRTLGDYGEPEKKRTALSFDQQKNLLNYVKNSEVFHIYLPLLQVMIGTGLRCGELIGLTWKDVDLKTRTVYVNHQLIYKNYGDGCDFHVTMPKTEAGIREIPMSKMVAKAFEAQRRLNFQMGIPRDVKIEGLSNFVFMSRSGRPMMPTTVNFILRDIVKAYNEEENERAKRERRKPEELPHISAHILRHTACTRMAETDLDMKVVQYVMGHANISVTMEVYNHITDRSRIEKEIAKMDLVQIM